MHVQQLYIDDSATHNTFDTITSITATYHPPQQQGEGACYQQVMIVVIMINILRMKNFHVKSMDSQGSKDDKNVFIVD